MDVHTRLENRFLTIRKHFRRRSVNNSSMKTAKLHQRKIIPIFFYSSILSIRSRKRIFVYNHGSKMSIKYYFQIHDLSISPSREISIRSIISTGLSRFPPIPRAKKRLKSRYARFWWWNTRDKFQRSSRRWRKRSRNSWSTEFFTSPRTGNASFPDSCSYGNR